MSTNIRPNEGYGRRPTASGFDSQYATYLADFAMIRASISYTRPEAVAPAFKFDDATRYALSRVWIGASFQSLAREWKEATRFSSRASEMAKHPAYQKIIRMGDEVVPFILKDLSKDPHHWFIALTQITGAQPVQATNRGDLDAMARDWLDWGRRAGYSYEDPA